MVTVYTCLKIYLYKKAWFIFVNNATFYSMLYHGVVEYVANTPGSNWCFSFAPELVGYLAPRDLHRRAAYSV